MMLKLYFVPVWLERGLKAYGEPVHTALDFDKLGRILSKRDVDFYKETLLNLDVFLPKPILDSFERPISKPLGDSVSGPVIPSELSVDEVKRNYLYGFLPDMDTFPTMPGFNVVREGYEQVILTVDLTPGSEQGSVNNLMNALLQTLNSSLPLEEVAALPIFEFWLSSKPQ